MELELIGALKIKDGLFVGDEFAAQDLEFVVANKANFVINCAARQIPNHWEPIGVKYLSFYWGDHDSQTLFEGREDRAKQIFSFIEQAAGKGESVLVHSVRGQNRCICVVAAYMMKKYSWSLQKALEFLHRRRPDIQIRPAFLQQLMALETKLVKQGLSPTADWTQGSGETEELVIRNTFLNSRQEPPSEVPEEGKEHLVRLNWADGETGQVQKLIDIDHPSSKNPVEDGFVIIRSCLKGRSQVESKVPLQSFKKPPRARSTNITGNKNRQSEEINKLAESLNFAARRNPPREETKKKKIKGKVEVSSEKKKRPVSNQRPSSPTSNKSLKNRSEKKVKLAWQT